MRAPSSPSPAAWWRRMMAQWPPEVRRFLVMAALIFAGWKALYHLWLQPMQWPDRPLVAAITRQTTAALNLFYADAPYSYKVLASRHGLPGEAEANYTGTVGSVYFRGRQVLMIVPNCNALELMILFAGFIVCFPGPWKEKAWIIPAGIGGIHLVNVLRCMLLIALANSSWRQYFDLAHHYLFTITIYLFIFLLWVWYVNRQAKKVKTHGEPH